MRVLLDLDCVLADFVGGVARLWGTTRQELERLQPAGEYDYGKAIGRLRNPAWPKPLTAAEFWKPINETPGFWLALDPLPWCRQLLDACLAAAGGGYAETEEGDVLAMNPGDLWIVTSPSRCLGCVREKEEWVLRHLGLPHDRVVPTPHKHLLAKPGVLLVDDYERNVDAFRRDGGAVVLFPARHNRLYAEAGDPLAMVLRDVAPAVEMACAVTR